MTDIKDAVLKIISTELDVEPSKLNDSTVLSRLAFGPFLAPILLEVQRILGVEIPAERELGLKTVGDLVSSVQEMRGDFPIRHSEPDYKHITVRTGPAVDQIAEAEIEEKVIKIVMDQLGLSEEDRKKFSPSHDLAEDWGADSLKTIEIGFDIGDAIGTTIPQDVVDRIRTTQDAIDAAILTSKSKASGQIISVSIVTGEPIRGKDAVLMAVGRRMPSVDI